MKTPVSKLIDFINENCFPENEPVDLRMMLLKKHIELNVLPSEKEEIKKAYLIPHSKTVIFGRSEDSFAEQYYENTSNNQ